MSDLIPEGSILIEAETFHNKGGWQIDQQFIHIMGSPYLLAHGMGIPVKNASTEIFCDSLGTYFIWVRTKDWCSGNWESPGRFQLQINGKRLDEIFGTHSGWGWQKGGEIEIETTKIFLELIDLTGFDGRCDAIFLTPSPNYVPPNDLDGLVLFRDELTNHGKNIQEEQFECDVVIVGGGIAGCAAALAAESQNLKVALINDRPVLGGNASAEIRVHCEGIVGKSVTMLNKIGTKHWPNGSAKAEADDTIRTASINRAVGIKQFLLTRAIGCAVKDNNISEIKIEHVESKLRTVVKAPIYIDCTGDGWLGFWAGADFRYGRESYTEYNEKWDTHGELWSPKTPDEWTMGSSLLWNTKRTKKKTVFPAVPWAIPVAKDNQSVHGEWYWEYAAEKLSQIDDAEEIRDHMLRAIYGSFWNAKQKWKNRKVQFTWLGFLLGKRESRRLMGEYIYSMPDMVKSTLFSDTVCEEKREIDVHYQRHLKDEKVDFLSTALFNHVSKYFIPFRTLYSRNISNLMMAGRNFSCTHVGLGGPRVMNTCGQMGIAVGYAAALCQKYNCVPSEIYANHIGELRQLIGYE